MRAKYLAGVIDLLFPAKLEKYANQFVANGDHRLFLLQRVVPARCEIRVQGAKLRILPHQHQRCAIQQNTEPAAATFANGRLTFLLTGTILAQVEPGVMDNLLVVVVK